MTAPLGFVGKGVKRGYKIERPVMRYDTSPITARIFGAHPLDVWRGKVITDIFE